MKTITKIGISAIGAAAVAGIGYAGKKIYDKKKSKSLEQTDSTVENVNDVEAEETEGKVE